MRLKAAFAGALTLCVAIPASATLYVSDYEELKVKEPAPTRLYVSGVGEGIFWANTLLGRVDTPMYCQPERLGLGPANYMDILEKQLERREHKTKDVPIEMVLLEGLMETFPCS